MKHIKASRSKSFVLVSMALVVCTMLPSSVFAGNSDAVLLGDTAAMTGGAVTAGIGDGTALWYNPAGIAEAKQHQVDVSGSVYTLRNYSIGSVLQTVQGQNKGASIAEVISVPSALTYVRKISENVNLAFGLFVPSANDFSLRAVLQQDQSGASGQGLISVGLTSAAYFGGAGLGWKLSDKLRIGAGLYMSYRSENGSVHFGLGVKNDAIDLAISTSSLLSNQYMGLEAGVGVQWDFARRWTLGLSVRSPGMLFLQSLRDTRLTAGGVIVGSDAVTQFEPEETNSFEFASGIVSPTRIRMGLAYQIDGGWLSVDGDIQHGLKNDELSINNRFVWNLRAGGKLALSEHFSFGLGVFTDRSSDPEVREFADSKIDFYGLATAIQYRNKYALAEEEDSSDMTFSTTIGLRYAYGSGDFGSFVFDPSTFGTGADDPLSEKSNFTVHELGIHLGSAFYF
ncbi:MAG: hypothetical protein IPJ88_07590 [Myxococcales bacterium]|nr:MAG: hypothetical protein IPJ88_07590 [Myxococcales bacterium]